MIRDELTQDEKILEVDRQIRRGGPVWCPWCRGVNLPNQPPCCKAFELCLEDRGEAQLASVISQRRAMERGEANAIVCPYCAQVNRAPEDGKPHHPSEWKRPYSSPFCCTLLEQAVVAIIERERTEACIRHAERVGEAVDKAARN